MLAVYGVLQERIMSMPYDGEFFRTSVFLVFMNRVVAVIYAIMMMIIYREDFWNKAPLWKYLAVSISNVAASTCQYEALKWVSFPVQMLGKSFKMLPVMIWGMAISSKSYSMTDWLVAAGVTGGVTLFLLTGSISSPNDSGSSVYGLLLLVAFLACDGFTSTFQEKLFKEHTTSKNNQMLYVNLCSTLVSLTTLLSTGAMGTAIAFCGAHPELLMDATELSIAAVGGQWFIYSQVKEFGALIFAATMNLRQVVSILISYAEYGHPITLLQMASLSVVFGALFYKSYLGMMSEPKDKADSKKASEHTPLNSSKPHECETSKLKPALETTASPMEEASAKEPSEKSVDQKV